MKKLHTLLCAILTYLILSLNIGTSWLLTTFETLTIDLIIFTLFSPRTGMDNSALYDVIQHFFIVPAVILLCILASLYAIHTHRSLREVGDTPPPSKLKKTATILLPILLLLILVGSLHYQGEKLNYQDYLEAKKSESTLYADYYVDGHTVDFTFPEKPKNLVYIVLESMETSFADKSVGGARETNPIPQLTELYEDNVNFTAGDNMRGFIPVSCTTWTAAALCGHFLGVPLHLPLDAQSDNMEHFLPGAFGLGDVLALADYNGVAVLGSDSEFGSRKALYLDHGITDILDHPEARKRGLIPQDYTMFWGYEDAKLFDYCKAELLRLADLEEPFFLTTLTVDTHFEDGYPCPDCKDSFDDQYSNVIACSDARIAEFISWMKEQDFYEDTVIVIAGDHLTMDSDYLSDISDDYIRTAYHTILNVDEDILTVSQDLDRTYSTLDLLPTTLASMGITWAGDRLALGTNLYSETPTLLEELGLEELNKLISMKSTYYTYGLLEAGDGQ